MVSKSIILDIEYKGKRVKVKNGLLDQINNLKFNNAIREYQANELYAVEKSELDERWVIFNEVKSLIPRELLSGYASSRNKLKRYIQEQGNSYVRENN